MKTFLLITSFLSFTAIAGPPNDNPGDTYGNVAVGDSALYNSLDDGTAYQNTAVGVAALVENTVGYNNAALGAGSLAANKAGNSNTACGVHTLEKATASNNTAVGANAGRGITSGLNNIMIGAEGYATDDNVIRIGYKQKAAIIAGVDVLKLLNTQAAQIKALEAKVAALQAKK